MRKSNQLITTKELVIFAFLGAVMFVSKKAMEGIPNIHLIGMLIMTYTLAFRKKALIPIYIYVLLDGLFGGFSVWWIPYLYIWTILWGVTMLLPKEMNKKLAMVIYPVVCMLHGFLFGTLYAPVNSIIMGLNFEETIAWIIAGFPFDLIHGLGNLGFGLLVLPLSNLLKKLNKQYLKQ